MFFTKEMIVFTESSHCVLFRLGKQDVSGFALATCYEYKKVPGKESFFAKDE